MYTCAVCDPNEAHPDVDHCERCGSYVVGPNRKTIREGDRVRILLESMDSVNSHGRVEEIRPNGLVVVSNTNQPYMGTFSRVLFTRNEVQRVV